MTNYELSPEGVARATYDAIRQCAVTLRPDFLAAIEQARAGAEEGSREQALGSTPAGLTPAGSTPADTGACGQRAASVLGSIVRNAEIGKADGVPICQDTGTVWVCLEVGDELSVPGNIFSKVNDAVAQAYTDGSLRMSVVKDALFDRSNTGDNTPAFCEVRFTEGNHARLHVLLKGGGSDNASRVVMLAPGAGRQGVMDAVLECVREKAANACPPLVVGVGVGATFDKVAGMAKHALLREIGTPAASEEGAAFEHELLFAINETGIGPGALGGFPTAVAVHLETAPCHIAALPVAINMGCCAMRSATIELDAQPACADQRTEPAAQAPCGGQHAE